MYQRLKTSVLCDIYRRLTKNDAVIRKREGDVSFYRNVLVGFKRGDLVFDIGANGGDKTDIFLRLGARVIAVDPDETNQRILAQRFLRLRLVKRPVTIIGKAVSDTARQEKMWVDSPGSALNTLSKKWVETLRNDVSRFGGKMHFQAEKTIETLTLEDLINRYGSPYYVKIDVEGHEPAALRGLARPIPYISFEVNLPEFSAEGRQCIQRLAEIDSKATFNYCSDRSPGLALPRWLDKDKFLTQFGEIQEASIEVFSVSTSGQRAGR